MFTGACKCECFLLKTNFSLFLKNNRPAISPLLYYSFHVTGLLRISRASDDDINGPYLVVDISQEQIDVDIAGFAYCLGISAEIRVIINNTHFYFHIEGDLFTIFQANLTVAASFGGALADMEYDVSLTNF